MTTQPFHILLVDDELADAQLFTELFEEISPSVHIHHAVHGRAALDYLEQTGPGQPHPRPQLIVLDLNMPVMNGHQFLDLAKAHDLFRVIPVLVLSTSATARDIERAYHLYASGYMVKPSTYEDLQALVKVVSDYWQGTVALPTIEHLPA